MLDLKALFEQHEGEFLKFERIDNPKHPAPDLCAFLMLYELAPCKGSDIVTSAEHDVIFLGADPEAVAAVVTEAQVIDLIRCGVCYTAEYDCFMMHV